MIDPHAEDPAIRFTPGDAQTTRGAGVKYARTLAGIPAEAFLEALAEHKGLVRLRAASAGFSAESAQTAAREFAAAARMEWRRIVSAGGSGPGGRA